MMIKLTFANPAKDEFWMRLEDIVAIQRDPANPLQTTVTTKLMTPKGPQIFLVLESADALAASYNNNQPVGSIN